MVVFAAVQYCIQAGIVGRWVRKGPTICWFNMWMVVNKRLISASGTSTKEARRFLVILDLSTSIFFYTNYAYIL